MLTIETISSFNFVEWCENIEGALLATEAFVILLFFCFVLLALFYYLQERK